MKSNIMLGTLLSAGLVSAAWAALDHSDLPSCYIYVHGQCFKNGQQLCTDEAYKWALDECDGYYPSVQGVVPPPKPLGLKVNTRSSPQVKARIATSFAGKKRIR